MEKRLGSLTAALRGMEVPLNAPMGNSANKRLRSRAGKATDFPKAVVVDKPINKDAY